MNITSLLSTKYQTIECSYERTTLDPRTKVRNEKMYTYKVPLDIDVKVGDALIVNPPGGYKIVIVTAVHDQPRINPDARYEYKWIVGKIDDTAYKIRVANEETVKRMVELREHQKKVQAHIDAVGLSAEDVELFKSLLEG